MITFITFIPLVAAVLILLTPSSNHRAMHLLALIGSLLSLVGVLLMIKGFEASAGLQFVEKSDWIPGLGVNYYVGVDGISLLVLLLTALIAPVTVLASSRTKGAKPSVASSNMSKSGFVIKAREIANICCSPPDN